MKEQTYDINISNNAITLNNKSVSKMNKINSVTSEYRAQLTPFTYCFQKNDRKTIYFVILLLFFSIWSLFRPRRLPVCQLDFAWKTRKSMV